MPQQEEMFAPADLATLEARARANAERIRRRYQEPERRSRRARRTSPVRTLTPSTASSARITPPTPHPERSLICP
jgi:hypothetical protein